MNPEEMSLRDKYQGAKPKTPVDMNPTSQNGDTFFMSPDMLPEGYKCQVGDELMVRMAVKSKGSKIGLTPVEVVSEEHEGGEEDMAEGGEQAERMPG